MAKRIKINVGDIFYLKLKINKYIFCRILFSVDKQYDKVKIKKKNDIFNYLDGLPKDTYLIEVFEGLFDTPLFERKNTKVLVPRMYVVLESLDDIEIGIIENQKVDPKKVEFPEILFPYSENRKTLVRLQRGELVFITDMTEVDYEELGLESFTHDICMVPFIVLNMMGLGNLIDDEEDYLRNETVKNLDILYHPKLRKKIYDELKIDPNKSYYELSKELGHDLSRFYE